jgi:hypothetical protein
MRTSALALVAAGGLLIAAGSAWAHCQVPCGIYDDPARITQLREDAATIRKAIVNIAELSSKHDPEAFNQSSRWVATKEEHATHVIDVVSEYFLAQKVKEVAAGAEGRDTYLASLADHHLVIRAAMKTKQGVSLDSATALDAAIEALAKRYP